MHRLAVVSNFKRLQDSATEREDFWRDRGDAASGTGLIDLFQESQELATDRRVGFVRQGIEQSGRSFRRSVIGHVQQVSMQIEEPRKVASEFSSFLRRHASVDHPTRDGRVIQVAQSVTHNAAFDGAFLEAWYDRHGMFLPASRRVLCTMQRAIWMFHEDKSLTPPTDYKLATLCEYFGVRLKAHEAHDALIDVRATVELYRQMLGHDTQYLGTINASR